MTVRIMGGPMRRFRFMLYDDDGETFNYENGDYSWTELTVKTGPDGNLAGSQQRLTGTIFQYSNITWKLMSPEGVTHSLVR
jgi:alpha-D-xyloside xylohydrolase